MKDEEETVYDEDDEPEEEKPKKDKRKKRFSDSIITWQLNQFNKNRAYIDKLLAFDNVYIQLPHGHELIYITKKGEQTGIRQIKITELFKYTLGKLNNIQNGYINDADVHSLLKCIDVLIGASDTIKDKLKDGDTYVLEANQLLQIKVQDLMKYENEVKMYMKETEQIDKENAKLKGKMTDVYNEMKLLHKQLGDKVDRMKIGLEIKDGEDEEGETGQVKDQ